MQQFPTTWTQLSLTSFCTRYEAPLLERVASRLRAVGSRLDAQDLLQAFFTRECQRALRGETLPVVFRQDRGRFRNFVLTALYQFVSGELRRRENRAPPDPIADLDPSRDRRWPPMDEDPLEFFALHGPAILTTCAPDVRASIREEPDPEARAELLSCFEVLLEGTTTERGVASALCVSRRQARRILDKDTGILRHVRDAFVLAYEREAPQQLRAEALPADEIMDAWRFHLSQCLDISVPGHEEGPRKAVAT